MKLLPIFLVWAGCLLPYLASSRQQLLRGKSPALISWVSFAILQTLAVWSLSAHFNAAVSMLIVLMLVMCMWVCLVVVAAHFSRRLFLVGCAGIVVFSLIAMTGGSHVHS